MRYHLTLVRMAITTKSTNDKCWRGGREKGTLLYCWWECKLAQPLWRTVWRFLKKLKLELSYDPAIPPLGIHLEKVKILIQKDNSPIYNTKIWKQLKCPSRDNWFEKMWYISKMEYHSAIKKNKILPFAATWMDLEIIILCKVSQTERQIYMLSLMCGI